MRFPRKFHRAPALVFNFAFGTLHLNRKPFFVAQEWELRTRGGVLSTALRELRGNASGIAPPPLPHAPLSRLRHRRASEELKKERYNWERNFGEFSGPLWMDFPKIFPEISQIFPEFFTASATVGSASLTVPMRSIARAFWANPCGSISKRRGKSWRRNRNNGRRSRRTGTRRRPAAEAAGSSRSPKVRRMFLKFEGA